MSKRKISIKNNIKDIIAPSKKSIVSDTEGSTNNKEIVFSFKNFNEKSHGLNFDADEFKALIKHFVVLSKLTWQQVQNAGKHQLGHEKIKTEQLKETLPSEYYDIKEVLSFRYSEGKPFVGIRNQQILDVLFIDPNFDLYKH